MTAAEDQAAAKKEARNRRRREADRRRREELKKLGITDRQYRAAKQQKPIDLPVVPERTSRPSGRRTWGMGKSPDRHKFKRRGDGTKNREMIKALVEAQPFIMNLRDIPDNGSTSVVCPNCRKSDASWEEYFCRYCGEHNDALYLKDHLLAPITLTREEIIAEYEAVGLVFQAKTNPMESLPRHLTYAQLTGVDPFAEMPKDYGPGRKEDKWDSLKGFRTESESFQSIS